MIAREWNKFVKLLSPRIVTRAMTTLDKSTGIVVGVCWAVALITLIFAIMAVNGAISAKKQAADALISEPVLPVATTTPIDAHETQAVIERLQRQFPDIKIDGDATQAITIKSEDGTKFHQWITALSYVDTMAPQYRWSLREFCVGKCSSDLMKAVIIGQKIVFTLPAAEPAN